MGTIRKFPNPLTPKVIQISVIYNKGLLRGHAKALLLHSYRCPKSWCALAPIPQHTDILLFTKTYGLPVTPVTFSLSHLIEIALMREAKIQQAYNFQSSRVTTGPPGYTPYIFICEVKLYKVVHECS